VRLLGSTGLEFILTAFVGADGGLDTWGFGE
jgi:hypothetical protein